MHNNRSYLPGVQPQSYYRVRSPGQSYGSKYKHRYGSSCVSENRLNQAGNIVEQEVNSTLDVAEQVAVKKARTVAA